MDSIAAVLRPADTQDLFFVYDEEGNLEFRTEAEEGDFLYDEIGSVLKIKQLLVYNFL